MGGAAGLAILAFAILIPLRRRKRRQDQVDWLIMQKKERFPSDMDVYHEPTLPSHDPDDPFADQEDDLLHNPYLSSSVMGPTGPAAAAAAAAATTGSSLDHANGVGGVTYPTGGNYYDHPTYPYGSVGGNMEPAYDPAYPTSYPDQYYSSMFGTPSGHDDPMAQGYDPPIAGGGSTAAATPVAAPVATSVTAGSGLVPNLENPFASHPDDPVGPTYDSYPTTTTVSSTPAAPIPPPSGAASGAYQGHQNPYLGLV